MTEENRIPTGGRTVIRPDGTSERITYYDHPLTKDEQVATEWFHVLSPNEQYREVRRMKWNLDAARKGETNWKSVARDLERELLTAQTKLARYTPEGFSVPVPAAELFELATAHGWRTDRAWDVDEEDETSAMLRIMLRNDRWTFKLTWSADKGGGARMFRSGLLRESEGPWRDAPSLKRLKEIIADTPVTEGTST